MQTPTLSTITRAFEKAAAQGKDYEILHILDFSPEAGGGARFRVYHKVEYLTRNYSVEINAKTQQVRCSCPEGERSGFCKHGALAVEEWQVRQAEDAAESAAGEAEDAEERYHHR